MEQITSYFAHHIFFCTYDRYRGGCCSILFLAYFLLFLNIYLKSQVVRSIGKFIAPLFLVENASKLAYSNINPERSTGKTTIILYFRCE